MASQLPYDMLIAYVPHCWYMMKNIAQEETQFVPANSSWFMGQTFFSGLKPHVGWFQSPCFFQENSRQNNTNFVQRLMFSPLFPNIGIPPKRLVDHDQILGIFSGY